MTDKKSRSSYREESTTDHFTRYTYVRNEAVYSLGPNGEKSDKPDRIDQTQPDESVPKFDALKDAIKAFLENEKYDVKKDGQLSCFEQEKLVYVGFQRIEEDKKLHIKLGVFFRTECEVLTTMKVYDVTLDELKKAIE